MQLIQDASYDSVSVRVIIGTQGDAILYHSQQHFRSHSWPSLNSDSPSSTGAVNPPSAVRRHSVVSMRQVAVLPRRPSLGHHAAAITGSQPEDRPCFPLPWERGSVRPPRHRPCVPSLGERDVSGLPVTGPGRPNTTRQAEPAQPTHITQ